jgi:hypothetical protein
MENLEIVIDRKLKSPSIFKGEKRIYTPIEKARFRANQNFELGQNLREVAEKANDIDALVTADLLMATVKHGNFCAVKNTEDNQGREFEMPMAFLNAPTRLDGTYARKSARRSRKRIVEAFSAVSAEVREGNLIENHPFFITLSYKNLLGVGFKQNFDFIQRVWALFRKRDYFKQTFLGGFCKIEFTLGERYERDRTGEKFSIDKHGYNFHIHFLNFSLVRFADCKADKFAWQSSVNLRLAQEWTDCVQTASREMFGCEIEFQEKTGNLAIVDVRPAALGEDGGYALEISKYLSKSNDFLQLPPDELLNAERIIRGKRLITSIGICNKFRGKSDSLLDNQNTNDGEVVSPSSAISSKLLDIFELPKSREIIEKPDSIREIGRKFYENGQKTEWLEFVDTLYKFQVEIARDNFLLRFPNAIVTDIRGGVFYGENVRPTKIREDLTVTFARIIKNTNKNIRRTKNYGN